MTSKDSPVLAGPPGVCCVKGVKHFGEPSGEIITIAGVQTYISKPPPAKDSSHDKKIILYLADVFGPFYVNAQLLQDYYASHGLSRLLITAHSILRLVFFCFHAGFTVLGIDYFLGDPINLHMDKQGFDITAWIAKSRQRAKEVFPKWVKEVRKIYGGYHQYRKISIFNFFI